MLKSQNANRSWTNLLTSFKMSPRGRIQQGMLYYLEASKVSMSDGRNNLYWEDSHMKVSKKSWIWTIEANKAFPEGDNEIFKTGNVLENWGEFKCCICYYYSTTCNNGHNEMM